MALGPFQIFEPSANYTSAPTASSFSFPSAGVRGGVLRFVNYGTFNIFLRFDGTDADETGGMVVLPGTVEEWTIPWFTGTFSAISPDGNSPFCVTCGLNGKT